MVAAFSLSDYFAGLEDADRIFQTDISIFADPVFSLEMASGTAIHDSSLRSWAKELRRLPWTSKEAEYIERLFEDSRVKTYLSDNATRDHLLSDDVRNAKVVHIATHGYFNPETPDIVGLATSKSSEDPTGFLTLTSLFSQRFQSNLIVISGCETALGDDLGAEGVNSLTRSFIANGAGSVIGTLWKIPDRPTAEFMGHFYSALKFNNGDASAALAEAKRTMMSAGPFKHPYFWSGFILTSANREFETNVFR